MRDDRIQVEEVLTFYNLGRTAWQPDGVVMKLPDGVTAFSAQAYMSDQGVDEVDERGEAPWHVSARVAARSSSGGRCRGRATRTSTSRSACRLTWRSPA